MEFLFLMWQHNYSLLRMFILSVKLIKLNMRFIHQLSLLYFFIKKNVPYEMKQSLLLATKN